MSELPGQSGLTLPSSLGRLRAKTGSRQPHFDHLASGAVGNTAKPSDFCGPQTKKVVVLSISQKAATAPIA